ncbi:bifunctional riboflavin kinase/FAD synthetase [Marinibaculum pumilum]|uniref:Riboflavin biosynthesis protein n=1 Tax=Marinibaculum pumilum TaxID=1766165 RepID=A0ABV7L368_9PROT
MRILRHTGDVPAGLRGGVAVLGNFDGVHRGHQALLNLGRERASALGAPLLVITFEPHPRSFFAPGGPPFRLTSLRSKTRLLAALGVDAVIALHFDAELSRMPADTFVDDLLARDLGLRHVVVGYDFSFGHRRGGNAERLRLGGEEHGFTVDVVDPVGEGVLVYSSTRIREALGEGLVAKAAQQLGHWWEIDGRIEKGDQRGRTIGFPTANVAMGDHLQPRFGVYAVRAMLDGGPQPREWLPAVANLGRRPTFDKENVTWEVHFLDLDADLYGLHVRTALVDFIRPEQKFDGLEALKAQIAADALAARDRLASEDTAIARFPLSLATSAPLTIEGAA